MTTAIIDRKSIAVDTAEEHAAHRMADAAVAYMVDGEEIDYNAIGDVVIEAHLPGHEYVTGEDYTRATVTVTPAIIARAKEIVNERLM